MDRKRPEEVARLMIAAVRQQLARRGRVLFLRGAASGILFGISAHLALVAALATGQPLIGAAAAPIGLVAAILLDLELVTGSFGFIPLGWLRQEASARSVMSNYGWVFLGNLFGAAGYGTLIAIVLAMAKSGNLPSVGEQLVAVAEARTLGYAASGAAGLVTAFVKAILCNWMACLAVLLAMSTTSALGKVVVVWMVGFAFFAQDFEHAVINMFMIPTGMMLGAKVSMVEWWFWNQIPVVLGNLVGGLLFTDAAFHLLIGSALSGVDPECRAKRTSRRFPDST